MSSVAFVTLTNNGYMPFTINCIESLKLINSEQNIECYCVDENCYNKLSKCYNTTLVHRVPNQSYHCKELQKFRKGDWSKVVINKLNVIYYNLLKHDYVLFADGDIVYEKNGFIQYCHDMLQHDNLDLLIQSDGTITDENILLCSGFMFIKSNQLTKSLFNPLAVDMDNFACDQIYINKQIKAMGLKYGVLPLDLFPNGKYYYQHSKSIKHNFIIHFNWCNVERKIPKMKRFNKFYYDGYQGN